ncbi:MAG: DNA topoisomerase I [Gammaproteobacteria bacterium TMED78]|nr:MAG: DNA topoisomerase I [Gammaproteobacteria bacterium TMED78]|tara:strand:+ start:40626 stop:42947 length:2322 start_codon:yes stop_codon:yes gene_type:complete
MSKNLVIVESPAKAKTIEKYLGKEFKVLASYGHVRDLIPKGGAVNPSENFKMKYQLIDRNRKHVERIMKSVKNANTLHLATDLDREGEAISWHIYEILQEKGLLEKIDVQRVVFNEVTKKAIQEAINNPRSLSTTLINAQQARRALDYLVGFNISPLLWRAVRPGLSAGRVQSPALKLITEREDEISKFKPREYWSVAINASLKDSLINAKLIKYLGIKVEQFSFTNEEEINNVEKEINSHSEGVLTVSKIEKKQRSRNPTAPFRTSTMQQEASRKLRFSAQKTMITAQKLYEGIDTGDGPIGLITYMRTDSVNLADDSITEIRKFIVENYGEENLPEKPKKYSSAAKNTQEAHEAIRPTSIDLSPEKIKKYLDDDQFSLYNLIWQRTLASQMTPAIFDTVRADLLAGKNNNQEIIFRANGSILIKPGFMQIYQESKDDSNHDDSDKILPPLKEGDILDLQKIDSEQHFTQPPPRYSEATLVKALEDFGIGRPSTYASIISTLRNREYVEVESRRFIPTDVGKVVIRFLTKHFNKYVDYDFTAQLEDSLDSISTGEMEWIPLLEEFWKPFEKQIEEIKPSVNRGEQERDLGNDPKSGRPMSVRVGRYGTFVQIGKNTDEEKPLFAGLKPGQKMDDITQKEALDLFKLPRELGKTPEGEDVLASIGRFGPYVKYGKKFASIGDEDPYEIELPKALEIIEEKKIADANRLIQNFEDYGIQVLNGFYGPYITDGNKNARMPKDKDPREITLEECQALIEAAPLRKRARKKKISKKK